MGQLINFIIQQNPAKIVSSFFDFCSFFRRLAWEHEVYNIRRIHSVTLSHFDNHTNPMRCPFCPFPQNISVLFKEFPVGPSGFAGFGCFGRECQVGCQRPARLCVRTELRILRASQGGGRGVHGTERRHCRWPQAAANLAETVRVKAKTRRSGVPAEIGDGFARNCEAIRAQLLRIRGGRQRLCALQHHR